MPTESPSCRQWSLRYTIDLALLILLAAAAIGGAFCVRHVEYVGGTKNSCGDAFLPAMAVGGLLLLASLGLIVRGITRFSLAPDTLGHRLLRVACLTAVPVILVGGFVISSPGAVFFLRGFEQWVLREVDTDAIQRWLATEGHHYAGLQYDIGTGLPEELPDFLVRFKPKFISFRDATAGGGPCVEFGWGGGLADWGLIVGLPDMPTPREGAVDLSGSEVEFRRPIKPGVYVVDRG